MRGFARLYLLPGIGHSRVGTSPDTFPGLDALVAWVEEGSAPDGLMISGGKTERTRPMCAYPETTGYDGSRAGFVCREENGTKASRYGLLVVTARPTL